MDYRIKITPTITAKINTSKEPNVIRICQFNTLREPS